MKKILLLGGSYQQVIAIQKAKDMGIYTILCDYLPDNPGQYVADKFYLESTTDKDTILKIASNEKIDGIIAYASDPAAPTAAYVAEKLSLPGNPYKSVDILCNKDKFREFLKTNKFNVPMSQSFTSVEEVFDSIKDFSFPIIIKPVDSSGSKGVTVLKSDNGLDEALKSAFSYSRLGKIIIEDFIEGKYSVIGGDIFVRNGNIDIWGLMQSIRNSSVNKLVPVGESFPLKIEEHLIKEIKYTLSLLVEKLEIKNGPMNVELLIDKRDRIYLVDIGPRSGGCMIPDLISDIYNIDIAKMSIEASMGWDSEIEVQKSNKNYAIYYLHSGKSGKLKNISFDPMLENYIYKKYIYKKENDEVEFFKDASKCLGIIFMKFPNRKTMIMTIENIDKMIKMELK